MDYSRKTFGKFPKIRIKFNKDKLQDFAIKAVALFIALVAFAFLWYAKDLPDPNKLLARDVPQSTKIYARDGTTLLYEVHGEYKRTLIPFSEMNDNVKHATIAIEDKDFYKESGINLKGILRSIYVDVTHGGLNQGGSTITQQFVRNAILTRDKSFSRKIKEIVLSLEINERFSKDDVLKLYLNEIPYGRNAYGIESAAQAYFGKHAKDLDLAESAYMAALPQSPSYYNPFGSHRDALDNRKNTVLDQMLAQGYINQQQHDQAKAEQVKFIKSSDPITAPHFVLYIEDYLSQKYGDQALQTGGLNVVTTLDPTLQQDAEQAVTDGSTKNAKNYNAHNAALVAIDPKTGQILAMVGSKDYFGDPEPAGCKPGVNCTFDPNVNAALAQRQPGSSGKPYVYVTAFEQQTKMSPATLLEDVVTNFGTYGGKDYIPHDYDGKERGPVSARSALAGSLNIPAVKVLDLVGVDNATKTMHDAGITSPLQNCGLSLVLGGCEVRLLDHVNGYATLADGGTYRQATGILKISDSNGNVLEQFQDQPKPVIDPQAVYEVVNIMSDYNARKYIFGTTSANLELPDRPVAAKTGTTQNFHDGWTLGFTPSLAAGVWVGNNNNEQIKNGADGVVVAGPIWHEFMVKATANTPIEAFTEPDGIQHIAVDSLSGKLPTQYTPNTKTEVFASYSVPQNYDDAHVSMAFDQTTGQPANSSTDPANIVNKVVTVLHSERPDLPSWENPVIAWALAHGYGYGGGTPGAQVDGGSGSNGGTGGSGGTGQNQGSPPTVEITSPSEGSTTAVPFVIQINATPDTGNSISRVDLLIDGTFYQTMNSGPYTFVVSQGLSSGVHSFAAHVVDDKGNTADTSVSLKIK